MFKAVVVLFCHKTDLKEAGVLLKPSSCVAERKIPKVVPVTPPSLLGLSSNSPPLSPHLLPRS